jgi:iron-sulfur cluster repair protein YtfE (RIC family)
MFDDLLWVHDHIRRELEACRGLARAVAGGASGDDIEGELATLKEHGILWQLRLGCMRYCRFVHMHHGAEDIALFPALRRDDPSLAPVLDTLESDHRTVASLLDGVEETGGALRSEDTSDRRAELVERLDRLSDELVRHLSYEEEHIGPALRSVASESFGRGAHARASSSD